VPQVRARSVGANPGAPRIFKTLLNLVIRTAGAFDFQLRRALTDSKIPFSSLVSNQR
jgi:hypothetical protein